MEEWSDGHEKWLEKLSEDCGQKLQVLKYEYEISNVSSNSVLQQLVAEGHNLLACLDELSPKSRTVSLGNKTSTATFKGLIIHSLADTARFSSVIALVESS